MTKYKELAEEANDKLAEALRENDILQDRLDAANTDLIEEMRSRMTDAEAKQVLSVFAERVKNKDELVLLIRALSKL